MPVNVNWTNGAQTILKYEFCGGWTWDNYMQAVEQGLCLAASIPHNYDVIADFTQSLSLPPNALSAFRKIWTNSKNSPANMGLIVMIVNSTFIETMTNMFRNLNLDLAKQFYVVRTPEAAYDFIQLYNEMYDNLPELSNVKGDQ